MIRFNEFIKENANATLADKAKKSGFSLGILKQVYKRGMAAWKVGHKPGTTPQQWGMARVNSFITGGRTRVKGDPDLWAKQKGKIRKPKKEDVNEADSAAMKAFLAKGGKITKLPPGKAAGYHGKDDPGKDMRGMMDKGDTKSFGTRKKVGSMK